MVKSLSKILYHGVKVLAKSLKKSVQEEIELSKQKASIRYADRAREAKNQAKNGMMTLEEAQQILNLTKLDPIQAEENFKQLFEANKGLKYLQSKVYRAKEAVDIELAKNHVTIENKSKNILKVNGVYVLLTYGLLNDK